ncbi:AI-2E family transporter [bacterium]|nr:AI-2E family transporter [bacterium]
MKNNITQNYLSVISILVFLSAFIWAAYSVLSPLFVGILLLIILAGLREYKAARILSFVVFFILFIWFLSWTQSVIFPFVIAGITAYLFDPVADKLQNARFSRTVSVMIIMLVSLGLVIIFGFLLLPALVKEIQDLIQKVPQLAVQTADLVQDMTPRVLHFLHIDVDTFKEHFMGNIPTTFEQILSNVLKGVTGMSTFLSRIFNLILIPILTFYFLKDFDVIKKWLLDLGPKKYRKNIYFYSWRLNRILGQYVRGQIIVCTFVGVLTTAGLFIFNIPFAILVGVMTGLLNVIPFLGLYISLGLALLTALFTSNPLMAAIEIGAVFLVVQGLEGYVISPKIVGDRVGLHPVAVIFSVLIFAKIFGFWGLIIGVPTAALIKFFIDEWKRRERWREILEQKRAYSSENR